MTVCIAVTFLVKPDDHSKAKEIMAELKQRFENEDKYAAVKSMNVYTQIYGGIYGTFMDLERYDSFAACEETQQTMEEDPVVMGLYRSLMGLIEPTTYQINAWQALD